MSSQAATSARSTPFPSGDSRPLSVFAAEPAEPAERYGLTFADESDDLDTFRFATLDLVPGLTVVLARHRGDPNPGTVVRIDAHAETGQPRTMLIAALNRGPNDVLWWSLES